MSKLPLTYLNAIQQGKSPADFAAKSCFHPKLVWVYDSVSGTRRKKYVPCGKCLRCQDSKRDEFVSRMILHMIDNPSVHHVYFVTLTYGTYNLNIFKNHPFKNDWLLTYPVCDSHNSSHHARWTPTLVIQSHVQKFFKRLRKNTGANITYVAAGEVGDTYSRPHHHLVIYSDKALSLIDIQHAWSYHCVKVASNDFQVYNGKQKNTPFWFRIGHVDYQDLVADGTCDWKAARTKDNSAYKCFGYVAKYICKQHDILDKFALARFRKAYNSCQTVLDYSAVVGKRNIKCYTEGAFGPDDRIFTGRVDVRDDYLDDEYYNYLKSNYKRFKMLNDVKAFNHIYRPTYLNYKNYETKQVHINGRTLENCDFNTFISLFSQYFTFSRSTSIGSVYFEKEYSRFKDGNFALPKAFGKELAFPSYYYSLLARKESPFCFRKTTISSTSLVKSNLSFVYEFYSRLREDKSVLYDISFHSQNTIYPFQTVKSSFPSGLIDPLYPHHGTLLDVTFYNSIGRIHYYYDYVSDMFNGFLFNKHTKSFVLYDSMLRQDMCSFICNNIEQMFSKHDDIVHQSDMRNKLIELINSHPDSYNTIERYKSLRSFISAEYKSKHLTKDYQ